MTSVGRRYRSQKVAKTANRGPLHPHRFPQWCMWLSVTSREGSCDPRCRQGAECSPQGTRSHRPPLTRVLLLKPVSRVSRAWDRPGRGLWSVALPLSRTPGAGPCSQRGPSAAEQHSADAPGGRRPCRFQATLSTHRAALSGGTAAPAAGGPACGPGAPGGPRPVLCSGGTAPGAWRPRRTLVQGLPGRAPSLLRPRLWHPPRRRPARASPADTLPGVDRSGFSLPPLSGSSELTGFARPTHTTLHNRILGSPTLISSAEVPLPVTLAHHRSEQGRATAWTLGFESRCPEGQAGSVRAGGGPPAGPWAGWRTGPTREGAAP